MNNAEQPRAGVLIIGHAGLPEALVAATTHVLGTLSRATQAIGIAPDESPEAAVLRVGTALDALDSGAGVLILVDAPGATPYRIASEAAAARPATARVTGVNLPMLVRVYNYPEMNLSELAESAVAAGQRSAALVS